MKSTVVTIALNTFREAIRAKWLIVYGVIFFLLSINIPTLLLLANRELPSDYLGLYLSTLVTVTFPFLPLFSLPIGSLSIVDERVSGSLQYVLANPISREGYLVGRYCGFLLATTVGISLGYGAASALTYGADLARYIGVGISILVAILLNVIILGLAMLISTVSKRQLTALGVGLFFWFLFVVLSNIGFLASIVSLMSGPEQAIPLILLNPVESARVLAVLLFNGGAEQLGTTGLIIKTLMGDGATWILLGTLLAWGAILFLACFLVFRHQDTS